MKILLNLLNEYYNFFNPMPYNQFTVIEHFLMCDISGNVAVTFLLQFSLVVVLLLCH